MKTWLIRDTQMYVDSKIIVMHELLYNEEDFTYCVTVTSIWSYLRYLEKEIDLVVALLVQYNAENIYLSRYR